MAHHPEGIALTTLHQAMDLQTDIFQSCGVPVNIANHILAREADKTHFDITVGNYNRVVDAARLLNLPSSHGSYPHRQYGPGLYSTKIGRSSPRPWLIFLPF